MKLNKCLWPGMANRNGLQLEIRLIWRTFSSSAPVSCQKKNNFGNLVMVALLAKILLLGRNFWVEISARLIVEFWLENILFV